MAVTLFSPSDLTPELFAAWEVDAPVSIPSAGRTGIIKHVTFLTSHSDVPTDEPIVIVQLKGEGPFKPPARVEFRMSELAAIRS